MTRSHKPSGTEWLGAVPADWAVVPAKSLFAQRTEPSRPHDVHLTPSQKFGVLPQTEYMAITGGRVVLNLSGADTMKHVEPGDVISHLRSFQGGLETSNVEGKVSTAYTVLRPRLGVDRGFYRHLFKSERYVQALGATTNQLRDGQSIRYAEFSQIPLPLPPLAEQRGIADYLDRETAKIDALIANQNEMIETLRERRGAVIETVMLEEAKPAPLGYFVEALAGNAFSSEAYLHGDAGVRLLRGINIKPGMLDWSETVRWPEDDLAPYRDFQLSEGDVVLGLDRPFVSGGTRVVAVTKDDLPALLLQRVIRLRARAGIDPSFLYLALQSRAFVEYATPIFTGVSIPHLSDGQVRAFRVPIPNIDRQRKLAQGILLTVAKIDTLIAKVERHIELAKERRSALVTAAVTGQIDVTKDAA